MIDSSFPTPDTRVPNSLSRHEAGKLAEALNAVLVNATVRVGREHNGLGWWQWGLTSDAGFGYSLQAVEAYVFAAQLLGGELVTGDDGEIFSVSTRGVHLVVYGTGALVSVSDELARRVILSMAA